MTTKVNSWILVDDGKVGSYSQCLGLARALGLTPTFKTMKPRLPWRVLPPQLWFGALHSQTPGHDALEEPWPDILIVSGRLSASPALAIKKMAAKNHKKCFTIFLLNPYVDARNFECVIVPHHDHMKGPTVISTLGALHPLNASELKVAADKYPHPKGVRLTTVLLGGNNRRTRYEDSHMKSLAEGLKKIGGHFFISPSRRTSPKLIESLKKYLEGSSYEMWDGTGDNPYHAYLGLADQIIVTQESISMISEACFTGKPVYVWGGELSTAKHREFHNDVYKGGYAKPFQVPLPQWKPKKLDEMGRVISFIKEKLAAN